jgi:hypothetical protein
LLFYIGIDPLQQIIDLATMRGLLYKTRGRVSTLRTSLCRWRDSFCGTV